MKQKLRTLFPTMIEMTDLPNVNLNDYAWFITDQDEVIGIPKATLTERDRTFLETFLTPNNPILPLMSEDERYWDNLVKQHPFNDVPHDTTASYRFIYYSVQPNQIQPETFKEAIDELFNHKMPMLWINDHSGILIETPVETGDESISYEQIIDILMSDLYMNIHFFVGPIMTDHAFAADMYKTLISTAATIFSAANQPVMSYTEAFPAIMVNHMNPVEKTLIITAILNDFSEDPDMLKTLETFVECNMNVSTTAKKLYMHRNSLQYRLDKFIEKTGIDIRHFPEAVSVYLALLAHRIRKQQDN